jgi:hypothetical protein
VPDLVDFLFPSGSAVESVGTIDHDAVNVADILIRMHHSLWDQHGGGIVLADNHGASTQKRL